jgi:hypothetical protein
MWATDFAVLALVVCLGCLDHEMLDVEATGGHCIGATHVRRCVREQVCCPVHTMQDDVSSTFSHQFDAQKLPTIAPAEQKSAHIRQNVAFCLGYSILSP